MKELEQQFRLFGRVGGWIGGIGSEEGYQVGVIQVGDIEDLVLGGGKWLERSGGCNLEG